ncbi:hypothetical protein J4440_03530 [Candidatus Woesearchaeota archaeon]|nr:hypothetical protein [Candidatus Woesearchaeota archaeon]
MGLSAFFGFEKKELGIEDYIDQVRPMGLKAEVINAYDKIIDIRMKKANFNMGKSLYNGSKFQSIYENC